MLYAGKSQRFRIQVGEMSYKKGVCGLNTIDGESNESVYGKFGMPVKGEGINCGGGWRW